MHDHQAPTIENLDIANHIPHDPTPKDQAVYVPSVTPGFAMDIFKCQWDRSLPNGIIPAMLNFLDPANRDFFHISHVMSSAGQALEQKRDCIIRDRDRASTVMIADSGGYQVASNRLTIHDDNDRLKILRWQEKHADIAITLDVPTGPVGDPDYKYKSFENCLDDTLINLKHFATWRDNHKVIFLNVLQGNNPDQADAWYEFVKWAPCEGWAIAGPMRHNIYHLLRRILVMYREGQIQEKKWLHVLGTAELETAVLLTALQRSIKRHKIADNLRISFDTSSAFRMLGKSLCFTLPNFEGGKMVMPSRRVPDGFAYVGSTARWPWPSAVGDRMTMGDICGDTNPLKSSRRDKLSSHLVAHHNLDVLCRSVNIANRVYDADRVGGQFSINFDVGKAIDKIDEVLAAKDEHVLRRYRPDFEMLRRGKFVDGGDIERSFEDCWLPDNG